MTGKKVRARYATNPELLGGAVVRVGSTIYDGSVRGAVTEAERAVGEFLAVAEQFVVSSAAAEAKLTCRRRWPRWFYWQLATDR